MIAGVDSAIPPSAASIISAKNAGVKMWNGYFYGPNIYHPYSQNGTDLGWKRNDFTRIKESGLSTLAYCSGWANPGAMKAQSASWGVPICLDVEGGIRGDGPWVQGWLDASGAGLYGNLPVHAGKWAPFHVVAAYPTVIPSTPRTWIAGATPPNTPCGWQYRGSHNNYGATIDSCWFDDWFLSPRFSLGSGSLTQENEHMPNLVRGNPSGNVYIVGTRKRHIQKEELDAYDKVGFDNAKIANVSDAYLATVPDEAAEVAGGGGGSSDTAAITALTNTVNALAKHLGVGTP